jgi:hypothetical protein
MSDAPTRRPANITALCILGFLLFAAPAFGQDAEARARALNRDAMEDDYLATEFRAAVAKLENALRICKTKCSKQLTAIIYGNLGTVHAAGLMQHADAVEAFKQMLDNDPKQMPNSAYLTGDVQRAFDEAKAALGVGLAPGRAPGVLTEKPWPEQATYHPVPVYVEMLEGQTAARVVVRYRAPGQTEWTELLLKPHGAGWGGLVPCPAVEREGELYYFTTAFDQNLDRVASAGSAERPRKVQLKTAISGRQPALPGSVPPTPCPRPETGLSCETDDDCPGAELCRNLVCVPKSSAGDPTDPEAERRKRNWFGVAFSPDLMLVSSQDGVCNVATRDEGKYACFFAGGKQVDADPLVVGASNSVKSGVGTGSMRVLVSYDRVLGQRMTAGVRLGFAFLGYPDREDGKKFLPLHAEARLAVHLLSDPFADKGVRPYVFAGGGMAESAARVTTPIFPDPGGGQTPQKRDVDVYQRAGNFFGGLGAGVQYAVSPEAAMVIEVGGRAMFPEFGLVIAPSLGFAYGI